MMKMMKVNPALNALRDIPMFEDKIAEANEVLRTVGLPEPTTHVKKSVKQAKKNRIIIKKSERL